jgi:hypothetical protein
MGSINCTVESTTSTTGSAVSIIRRVGGKKRKKRKQVLVDIFLIFFISSWVLFVFNVLLFEFTSQVTLDEGGL